MIRRSARAWIVIGCMLGMIVGPFGIPPADGPAVGEASPAPRAPIAVPDHGRSTDRLGDIPLFPLAEVHRGLHGVGKTVIQGTDVATFDVEVLGVLENAAPSGDLILIRVSGPVVERAGGIASGMSGSPVYIDGRLLGAIGYGFNMADPTVGMVTPIASMRSLLELLPGYEHVSGSGEIVAQDVITWDEETKVGGDDEADGPAHTSKGGWYAPLRRPVSLGDRVIEGVAYAPSVEQAKALQERLGADVSVMQPVATPVLAAGWGERALGVLDDWLADYPVAFVRAGGGIGSSGVRASGIPAGSSRAGDAADAGGGFTTGWSAEPGSAFGVQLMRGDVSLSALGTITAVVNDAFLGFGHPFLNMGESELYATGAAIFTVVDSISAPFKIGTFLDPIGSILQDRGAGVAGKLGVEPSWIPIEVRVQDEGTRSIRLTRAEVAGDPQLAVPLAASAALQGFDQSIDRIGPGTAEVTFEIRAEGLPTRFVRENIYYSPTDISAYALTELVNALDLLIHNPFRKLEIERIRVDAEVTQERHTARIEHANPSKEEVRAGESVDVEVTIRPFRAAPVTEVITLGIPPEMSSGDVVVTVRGGGIYFVPTDYALPAEVGVPGEPPLPDEEPDDEGESQGDHTGFEEGASESLEEVVSAFMEREQNNELIAEFYPPYQYGPPGASESDPTAGEAPADADADADSDADSDADAEADTEAEAGAGADAQPPQEDAGPDGGSDGEGTDQGAPSDPEGISDADGGASEETGAGPGGAPVEPIQSSITTPYVMEGQLHFNLTILPPKKEDEPKTKNGARDQAQAQTPAAGAPGGSIIR